MKKIKAVIVDDEVSNLNFITDLISELNPCFDIIGQAHNVKSGFDLITEMKPEVVFLDIKMPDGSGFTLLEMFSEITFEVVFISGFDEYALKAFEFNAMDYVLKPIDAEKFSKTLKKVHSNIESKGIQPEELKLMLRSYDLNQLIITKIPVHAGKNVFLLTVEEIVYVKSEAGCTEFKIGSDKKYTSAKQLSDFEFILENHPYMVRVNKGTYINLNHILSYSKGMTCFVTLKDKTVIEISRRKKGEILELLAKRSM